MNDLLISATGATATSMITLYCVPIFWRRFVQPNKLLVFNICFYDQPNLCSKKRKNWPAKLVLSFFFITPSYGLHLASSLLKWNWLVMFGVSCSMAVKYLIYSSTVNQLLSLCRVFFSKSQVQWQETPRGYVAGVLTTQRVLMVSADFDILASSSTKYDRGLPSISWLNYLSFIWIMCIMFNTIWMCVHWLLRKALTSANFRSLLWVGPALLFSTTTAVCLLGWDGKVRTILSISTPYAGKQILFH